MYEFIYENKISFMNYVHRFIYEFMYMNSCANLPWFIRIHMFFS